MHVEVCRKREKYFKPELIRRGDVQSITQGLGDLGSGDMFYRLTKHEGCFFDQSPVCTGS
jgi:hypothetical protein